MTDEIRLSVGVLGPVVLVRDGISHTPQSPVLRALLGALAVAAPQALSTEQLAATVWGDQAPRDVKATLQLAVFRLRRWLKESTGGRVAVHTNPGGYQLDLGLATSDLARFRELTTAQEDRYNLLSEAVTLWRGRPLANVPA